MCPGSLTDIHILHEKETLQIPLPHFHFVMHWMFLSYKNTGGGQGEVIISASEQLLFCLFVMQESGLQ